ncbi:hypothetical protein DdX_19683 [Ditylenchus destructor]|uniref:Uncharacterized protein n=1 Tax=Ditylenchus destructor TaxID=166010 RepID=A0AAD4QS75_9BILA|nr:hypothetical protein DdX_19680 [Ditylenchus destructor]KAI1695254.1 hypothetical protein DdX_19683 [Ditylenchus destructor]
MPIVYIPMLGTMLLNPHHGYIDDPEGKLTISGMPGLVYLCMNKSVRSSISAAILPRAKRIATFGATGQVITGNVTTGNLSSSKDTRKYEQEVDVA